MQKRRSLLPLILIPLLAVVLLAGAWIVLNSLPTRQLARFPKFIQTMIIPEPESAVLPAPEQSADADALLAAPTAVIATPDPLPTPEVVLASAEIDATATPTLEPMPTATPIPTPTLEPLPSSTRIENFQHKVQDWNNCGPATLAMALTHFGLNYTQQQTAAQLKPNEEDRNVTPGELAAFVNNNTEYAALARVNGNPDLLRRLLANGFPAIIEIGLDPPGEVAYLEWYGHYLLATGYDDKAEDLWVFDSLIWDTDQLRDQNSPFGRSYAYEELNTYWPQFNNAYVVFYDPARSDELAAILGDDLDERLMWERSLQTARDRLADDPENAFFWFNLGSSLVNLGQYEEAVTAFDKARSIGLPWRMLWYQFGPYEAYYQVGRYVDVVLLANTTLEGRPFFEESYYYRGIAQAAMGDVENARTSLQDAVTFNPLFMRAADALSKLDA